MRKLRPALLTIAACALAAPAHAQVVQDRYGPPPARSAAPLERPASSDGGGYAGPMLGWANKVSPQAPSPVAPAAPPAPERPQAMALAHQFARTSPPQTPPAPVVRPAVQPGYEPVARAQIAPAAPAPGGSPALLGGPPAQPLPQSLYGPAPASAPAPAQQVAAATPAAGGRTHLYSVHRPYGLEPDAIPAPPAGDRYILVGPPDAPPDPEEAADDAEGLDRQF